MRERCEDAPCCGCCGINIYGVNQEDGDPRSDEEIKDEVYRKYADPDYDDDQDFGMNY